MILVALASVEVTSRLSASGNEQDIVAQGDFVNLPFA